MASSPQVFLSYARKDGEPIVNHIRQRLHEEHRELELWQDLVKLRAGAGWFGQLLKAIEKSQYLVMLMTPEAQNSPIVQKEWRHARQNGVCVIPVLWEEGPRPDFSTMSRWMSKPHFYTLPRQWDLFVAHLRSPCQATRVPFMAPDLPEGLVERPDEFGKLVHLLLDSNRANPVAITTALHGAGGFGKTTLATALCHDDDVTNSFDDGILWVTLGEQPSVREGLAVLYAALTGERPAFVNEKDAEVSLAAKLDGKNCLIVVDDVWDPAHLRPFLTGGKGCARLVTTRQFEVAVQGERVDVDEMTPSQAAEMLAGGVGASDPRPFAALARRLGEWPLLLELARGALKKRRQRGDSVDGAVAYVNRELDLRGFTAFDRRDAKQRNEAVSRSIGVSLDLLEAGERERYSELGIFPEDVDVPLGVVADLWRGDREEAEWQVERLHDLSLVKFDVQAGTIRLHNVLRGYLAGQLTGPASLHARLVEAWPDSYRLEDMYRWRWIAWHLMRAGRSGRLRELLLDFRWIEAKLAATGANALIADYELLREDTGLRLVQAAIRLSAHILAQDRTQLAGQLWGRLGGVFPDAGPSPPTAWLRPLQLSLAGPGPLLRTLSGHSAMVSSVAVSPDGKRVVSASSDQTLKVWDLESGEEIRTLRGHSGGVRSVAVTPDGRRALSASDDLTLKVWNLQSGDEVRTLCGHSGGVRSVTVTPDGKWALSASDDQTLKVWDLESGEEVRTLRGHSDGVAAVAVTPEGKWALSASDDETLKVWDLESGEEVRTLRGHSGWVNAVAVTPDGERAVSASDDQTLKVWDLESGEEVRTLGGHSGGVRSVAVTPEGKWALSASDDETLKVWDLESGEEVRTLRGHSDGVAAVAVAPQGKQAVSASGDQTVKVWDLESGDEIRTLRGHRGRVWSVAVTPDGKRAVSASDDQTLKMWDLESGEEIRTLRGHRHGVWSVAVTPDGKWALSASDDETVKLWHLESGEEIRTLRGHRGRVWSVAVTPDGKRAVSASDDQTLKMWDLESGEEIRTLRSHSGWVAAVAVTPEGKRAVSASDDRTLKVWDLESGEEVRTLRGHGGWVRSVAVTPDGKRAVSASSDQTLKVWDLESGDEVRTLRGHGGIVWSVAVTPDGKRALSASPDRSVRVWDLETGTAIATFIGDAAFGACAVAPDGKTIVAGDAGGAVHFLRLEEERSWATHT